MPPRATEPPPRADGALFAVLAGGRASRLGGDKAGALLGGRPLLAYPLAAALTAAGANGEVTVVAKPDTALPELGEVGAPGTRFRVLREPPEPVHPLCGIVAALGEASGRPVVVVAADMPFVTPGLLGWMAGLREPLAVPSIGGRLQPLLGRYDDSQLGPLGAALQAERAVHEAVASQGPREIALEELRRFGDPDRLLFNLNTPADLRGAEGMLAG